MNAIRWVGGAGGSGPWLGFILGALASSCAWGGGGREKDVVSGTAAGDWIDPSPILRAQIDDEAARLPWTHGFERLEQIRWFASVGEPAYSTLLQLAVDGRDDVAAAALASLGATGDRRLVPSIRDLAWEPSRLQGDLGFERARTLLRLGDWSTLPTLIGGLSDERLYTRALCFQSLKESTRETHGFDPRAEIADREAAIARWTAWWGERSGEGILTQK
jgi:hypothetical protein